MLADLQHNIILALNKYFIPVPVHTISLSLGGSIMCTAATYQTKDFYFGRNLDLHLSYGEMVTITPRNFPFHFRPKYGIIYYTYFGGVFYGEI